MRGKKSDAEEDANALSQLMSSHQVWELINCDKALASSSASDFLPLIPTNPARFTASYVLSERSIEVGKASVNATRDTISKMIPRDKKAPIRVMVSLVLSIDLTVYPPWGGFDESPC